MTDKYRLIELIKKAEIKEVYYTSDGEPVTEIQRRIVDIGEAKHLADYLLANGVIVPKREKDEHKIQIGDVLYEYSYTYGKVHEWKVLDIWLENYISGNKTIVKCSNGSWTKEFFVVDVLQFHKTKEEAEEKLKELKNG